jgi:hypothetical protein
VAEAYAHASPLGFLPAAPFCHGVFDLQFPRARRFAEGRDDVFLVLDQGSELAAGEDQLEIGVLAELAADAGRGRRLRAGYLLLEPQPFCQPQIRAAFISLLGPQVCVVVFQRLHDPSDFLGIEIDLHTSFHFPRDRSLRKRNAHNLRHDL